jgi:predicted GH43/DUF377 family glycosyl hydrolase
MTHPLDNALEVRRSALRLRPDPSRVITRPFMPGQESLTEGLSRAESVVERILALSDKEVSGTLAAVIEAFSERHANVRATFRQHFEAVAHRIGTLPTDTPLSTERTELIGAYLTQEYSVESAALFNPSIVAHPDQSPCEPGELRFIMSVRAVGEGHLSTVEFRTGTLGPDGEVAVDVPDRHLSTGRATPIPLTTDFLRAALDQHGDAFAAESVLRLLPATFTPSQLEEVLASSELDSASRSGGDGLIDRVRSTAATSYRLRFDEATALTGRVLMPSSAAESHGMEDVRFVRSEREYARPVFYGTYTAYDGVHVAPHLMATEDFCTFDIRPMIGPAAQNKGMALFPSRIGGQMWSLSRWDRENISVAQSPDGIRWGVPQVVQVPHRPWDLVQLGACSSPIETTAGWLVLTHGVGPMRVYSVGALLLDLEDPTRVIGVLDEPLITPAEDEREGYVPNVVYSCGALVHGTQLVVPYGCSDASIRFAFVDLPGLLDQLISPAPVVPQADERPTEAS